MMETLLMIFAPLVRCGMLLALCLGMSTAQAHKSSDAYLNLVVMGSQISVRWDVHLRDLDGVLALDANDDGQINWGEVRTRWADIEAAVWPQLALDAGAAHCEVDASGASGYSSVPQLDSHSDGQYAVLQRVWRCASAPHVLRLNYRLFAATDAAHRGIVSMSGGGLQTPLTAVLVPSAGERRFELSAPTPLQTLREFVREGVWHIATGADHLLFLLALLLPAVMSGVTAGADRPQWQPAPAWRPVVLDVLRVVTAFTVAHSITLGLAVWGVFSPPSRWVESAIAASVVFAALNNLRPVVREGRWVLTFAFGLIHGFGFASTLKDLGLADAPLGWSLLGFNLGVELGQLAVVAAFVPLAWALRATVFYRRGVLAGGSGAIAMLAALWLVERAADVSLGLPF
jgi:hypothetical protein